MSNSTSYQEEGSASLEAKKEKWIKTAKWIYWTLILFISITMIMAGVGYLASFQPNVDGILLLGYPVYILKILGTAKVLGGLGLLQNRFKTLKEWAYSGYSFNLLGAAASYALSGVGYGKMMIPLTLFFLLMITYRQWKTGWM
ncbi:DoxX family protein [Leptospira langatensis]|uniref:DoxX family protein n=1 Tax=Leptospira langatensis TaxID=2484983 RepID=A0A5F1ZXA6_9LEPT|nr:DoxX family protein [Leptospira langatensis]TGJ98403.1 DoxX family protein [Leptospira langatensis]TGL43318.1 DoxX family protein [Leptospira langatensis]